MLALLATVDDGIFRRHSKQLRIGLTLRDVGHVYYLRAVARVDALYGNVDAELRGVPDILDDRDDTIVADGARIERRVSRVPMASTPFTEALPRSSRVSVPYLSSPTPTGCAEADSGPL